MKIIETHPREVGFVLCGHCQKLLDDPRKSTVMILNFLTGVWANTAVPDQNAQDSLSDYTRVFTFVVPFASFGPRSDKTGFLHLRKQRRRSASR